MTAVVGGVLGVAAAVVVYPPSESVFVLYVLLFGSASAILAAVTALVSLFMIHGYLISLDRFTKVMARAVAPYTLADLQQRWIEGTPVVYIGKAEAETLVAGSGGYMER